MALDSVSHFGRQVALHVVDQFSPYFVAVDLKELIRRLQKKLPRVRCCKRPEVTKSGKFRAGVLLETFATLLNPTAG